jgi:hypothetical protein
MLTWADRGTVKISFTCDSATIKGGGAPASGSGSRGGAPVGPGSGAGVRCPPTTGGSAPRRRRGTTVRRLTYLPCLALVINLALPGPVAAAVTPNSTITTLTGNGSAGFSGDGGPAARAQVNLPRDSDVGPDGSIYLADTYNNRIRKIDPRGIITTYAGTGVGGFGGDGGPARNARLKWPHDVVVDDASGTLYFADSNNDRIRKITRTGIITTVAGTGRAGFSGDGGPATAARLSKPKSVALHGGFLYLADSRNHRIRRVNLGTGIITTVAGTGVAGFGGDSGPARAARLNVPQRIALDGTGGIFIADTENNRIRRVTPQGTITTVAGTGVEGFGGDGGPARQARLRLPRGIAVGGAIIYIADTGNHRVRQVNQATGIITTVAGTGVAGYSGDGGRAGSARLDNPRGLTVDNQGRLLIADTFNSALRRVAA